MLLVFAGCEKDEAVVNPHEDRDQSVATVSQKEVSDYLNAGKSSGLQNKDSGLDLTLDLSLSEHEPLTNTNQKLLVVPAQTRYHAENTRAVFLKIEGTIEPLLIFMFVDKDVEGAYFSGRIMISELDGKFKRGFRVENGVFTHSLVRDVNGNIVYEETPWFVMKFPDSSDRKRIKDILAAELSGKDTDGNNKTQKGTNAGC